MFGTPADSSLQHHTRSASRNSIDGIADGVEITPDEANESLHGLNVLLGQIKEAAERQARLANAIANNSRSIATSKRSLLDDAERSLSSLPPFVEQCKHQFHSVLHECRRLANHDRSDASQLLSNQMFGHLASSLHWLSCYAREAVAIVAYVVDDSESSNIGLQDLHDFASSLDGIEKLIRSTALAMQHYYQGRDNNSTATLLLEGSGHISLAQILNTFAETRSRLCSKKLLPLLLPCLTATNNSAIEDDEDGDYEDYDADYGQSGDDPRFASGTRLRGKLKQEPRWATIEVDDAKHYSRNIRNGHSSAGLFLSKCSAICSHELQLGKTLIDCFSQSSGFISALSQKTLRKSNAVSSSMESLPLVGEDFSGEASLTSSLEFGSGIGGRSAWQQQHRNNRETPLIKSLSMMTMMSTAGSSSRPASATKKKSIVWSDQVDAGVRSRLEGLYSERFAARLQVAILSDLFYSHLTWSLSWQLLQKGVIDLWQHLRSSDASIEQSTQLITLAVLSSLALRSFEIQRASYFADIADCLYATEKLSTTSRNRCRTAFGCVVEDALRMTSASLESMPVGETHQAQLQGLYIGLLESLVGFVSQFVATKGQLYLAKKQHSLFNAIIVDAEVLIEAIRVTVTRMGGAVPQKITQPVAESKIAQQQPQEVLLARTDTVNNLIRKLRDLFASRLTDDVLAYLASSMPTSPDIWRNKTEDSIDFSAIRANGYVSDMFHNVAAQYLQQLVPTAGNKTEEDVAVLLGAGSVLPQICRLLLDSSTSLFMGWLQFIQSKKIMFGGVGPRQLEADFLQAQMFIEQQISSAMQSPTLQQTTVQRRQLIGLVLRDVLALPIFRQLRTIVSILSGDQPLGSASSTGRHSHQVSASMIQVRSNRSLSNDTDVDPLSGSMIMDGSDGHAIVTSATRRRRRGLLRSSGNLVGVAEEHMDDGSNHYSRHRNNLSATSSFPASPTPSSSDFAPCPIPFGEAAWTALIAGKQSRLRPAAVVSCASCTGGGGGISPASLFAALMASARRS